MPRLRFAGRLTSIDIDKIARLLDHPCLDIFIRFQARERVLEHPAKFP
jgi:hypothetical protein